LNNVNERLDYLESTLAFYYAELLNFENNLAARCDSIEVAIDTKADASEVETLS